MAKREQIDEFLASAAFGVVGASTNRHKYGNKVLRCYLQHDKKAIPVNPNEAEIEGIPCAATIGDLPADALSISMITPPAVTLKLVPLAVEKGIRNIWISRQRDKRSRVAVAA